MVGANISYESKAGSLNMILMKQSDLVKAFRTIMLMEQQRIDNIKAEEKDLAKAKELIEESSKQLKGD